jgi:hypothetical protein
MSHPLPPLALYVLWHHSFSEGEQYANRIFTDFKRNAGDPLSRGINIPVFFRSHEELKEIPADHEQVVVIALVDAKFVNDSSYRQFLEGLAKRTDIHVIPAALSTSSFNVGIPKINFIRLFDKDNKYEYLVGVLAHEIARHLYQLPKQRDPGKSPAPLRLFISHAKIDGLDVATRIKKFTEEYLPLKTFFDANDITVGYDFESEIEDYIKEAVVIAVQTDKYSSREWCRREILLAKKSNRPIVILNCLKEGETRSFPYMANVLTVHFLPMDETVWMRLMAAVMKETLRLKYQDKWIEYILGAKNQDAEHDFVSSYPPELVTALYLVDGKEKRFIYPDPPLGTEEMELLARLDGKIKYVTANDL